MCVYTKSAHTQFLAVFLYGFSRTESAAISVIGLRLPLSAVCAEGCVAGMCPYCFILLYNIWCSFCPFQAAHGLRIRTKVRTKQFPAKDFGHLLSKKFTLVVQKIHAGPINTLLSSVCKITVFCLFAGFCGTRPGSCRNV